MPARTVVLEKLEKFNGEARVPITPGEYTQLTGRAGRRGIDTEGHAVIQWTGGLDPQAVASLASRRTYPLNSSFRPTYNMAVNLIEQFGRDRARTILESSFAQFQADRAVVDLARTVRKQQESLQGYATAMECHLGDFGEYSALRRELSDLEKGSTGPGKGASQADRARRQKQMEGVRKRMRTHPCHGCAEREAHARWAERWWRLGRDNDKLSRQITGRTGAVAAVFDRVTVVLDELGYLTKDEHGRTALTVHGRSLRRIYGERDLLVAECLRRGHWKDLDAAGLAASDAIIFRGPTHDRQDTRTHSLPARRLPAKRIERTQDSGLRPTTWNETHTALPGVDFLTNSSPCPMLARAGLSGSQAMDVVCGRRIWPAGTIVLNRSRPIDPSSTRSLSDRPRRNSGSAPRTHTHTLAAAIVAYSSARVIRHEHTPTLRTRRKRTWTHSPTHRDLPSTAPR